MPNFVLLCKNFGITRAVLLQYCEEQFLEVAIAHGLCKPPAQFMSLSDILRSHMEDPKVI